MMGTCARCGASFTSTLHAKQVQKRFCSDRCRQAVYRKIPWVRQQNNIKRNWRRTQKKRVQI